MQFIIMGQEMNIKDSMKIFGMVLIAIGIAWFIASIFLLGLNKLKWLPAGILFIIGSIFVIFVGFLTIHLMSSSSRGSARASISKRL